MVKINNKACEIKNIQSSHAESGTGIWNRWNRYIMEHVEQVYYTKMCKVKNKRKTEYKSCGKS